jgi:hypothetical protein
MNLKNIQQKLPDIITGFGGQKQEQSVVEEKLAKIVQELEGRYAARRSLSFGNNNNGGRAWRNRFCNDPRRL